VANGRGGCKGGGCWEEIRCRGEVRGKGGGRGQ